MTVVDSVKSKSDPKTYKTIFISDIHLGSKACQAELLLDFLRYNDSEKLYLVGDIVDGWRLKRKWFWPQSHNDVVQKILRKARKGTEVIYVPGNHDEDLGEAVNRALKADKKLARKHALGFSWQACADIFLSNLVTCKAANTA